MAFVKTAYLWASSFWRTSAETDRERDDWGGLYSSEQMARVLRLERARTDRSGVGFSLLVLSPSDHFESRDALLFTARMLRRRLRSTDEAGWLDRQRLAVVLPATPPHGARTLGEEVCSRARRSNYHLVFRTYYYPSDSWSGEKSWLDAGRLSAARTAPVRRLEPVEPVEPMLAKLCSEHDPPLDAARAFPEPPGMAEYRQDPEKRRQRFREGVSEGAKH